MIVQQDHGALNDALSQNDRKLQVPAPERVKVDGRSLADLLAFAADYGALIHYYDLTDTIDGDWSAFFSGDPSIRLALRAALDLPDIETELERLLRALREAGDGASRLAHWVLLEKLLLRLAGLLEPGRAARASLAHALADLMAGQAVLAGLARRLVFHWGDGNIEPRLRHGQGAWFEELLDLLDEFTAALIEALSQARTTAAEQLDASLRQHDHAPQSALWAVFAQLFGHAQARLNQFPRHLVRFYQHAVLRQDGRGGRPDQLILSFTPAAGVARADLAKGTLFSAGKDADGQSIAYALDAALTVDVAAVAQLRTLTLAPQATVAAAQVLCGSVKLAPAPPAIAAPFPLFGANSAGLDGSLASTQAALGFALASPCLMLAGGNRTVTLGLSIAPACVPHLVEAFGACGLDAGGAALPAMLARLLQQAFALSYSNAAGWIAIQSYTVAVPAFNCGPYLLSFTLGPDAAPWGAPGGPSPPTPDLVTPTLYASLLQAGVPVDGVTVYPYKVLARLDLSNLSIEVVVDGLPPSQMTTMSGAASLAQPVALFGAVPVQNAAFSISAPELFVKQIDAFTMTINWTGLPVTSNGFSGYYKGYVIDADGRSKTGQFDNAAFTVGMTVVNPGAWQVAPWSGYLFQTSAGTAQPADDAMPLAQTVLAVPVASAAPGSYYNPALSQVSLVLTNPAYAFGAGLYAPNVMAASLQLTATASACAQSCGQDGAAAADAAAAQLEPLASTCATAPDGQFRTRIHSALRQTVANLDGAGVQAINTAIAEGTASAASKDGWQASLAAALDQSPPASRRSTLAGLFGRGAAPASRHDNLARWLSANGAALAAAAPVPAGQAQALLAAAEALLAAVAKADGQPPRSARPMIAASVRDSQASLAAAAGTSVQACIHTCMAGAAPIAFPNQPWVPLAASVTLHYTAAAVARPAPGQASASAAALTLFQLGPCEQVAAADWSGGASVPLLAPLPQAGVLTIDLTAPAQDVSLLFQLAPPPSGWPTDTPAPCWAYWSEVVTGAADVAGAGGWIALQPRSDSTNGMRQSGIVRFALDGGAGAALLRLQVGFDHGDAALFPLLAALSTNAASASWVGPGGAAGLDMPLPAGTISKPLAALPGIGGIAQPVASFGGRSAVSGPAADLWLAERLRHKDYGIQAWDYASLVLAAYPSLWQVAVTPASDGQRLRLPGQVWVVAVPGPDTPAIFDPTMPSNDAQMLAEIAACLSGRISPFVELSVTNPPYQRLCVVADVLFTDADAVPACIDRLNAELVAFLSPWPPQGLAPRPDQYYTRQEVSHFIRHRPYVRGILSLQLVPQGPCPAARPYYTTVLTHRLSGKSVAATQLPRRPSLALPGRAGAGSANGAPT